jgi:hypothetical protein
MAARGVQVLIAATALIGLAACGSATADGAAPPASTTAAARGSSQQPATGASTPTGGSLCSDGQTADRVTVSGSAVLRQVTLHGVTQVQAMVAALCALPAMPPGHHCPAASADSDSVRLVFAAGEQSFPPVSVQESNCHGVTGLGATRSWSPSSAFGRMLSEAVGGVGRLVPGTHPSSVPTGP